MRSYDFVIVGGGIVGLAVARELIRQHPKKSIAVLEKEHALGKHASGRNSGVLHSGIYYPVGSLKGRLCAAGAREMAEYCIERGLPIDRIGKVILPVRDTDDPQLDMLAERARANGAEATVVTADELRELEPAARTLTGRALFSPNTSVIDPKAVLSKLHEELSAAGVQILFDTRASSVAGTRLQTSGGAIEFGTLVNCAGLHADAIAKLFGTADEYVILPFKGIYFRLSPSSPLRVRRLIYPVPDLRVPFLGVHFTRAVDGTTYVGPTAVPALGRENYHGVDGINGIDLMRIGAMLAGQYASNKQGFRVFVHEEATRFLKPYFVRAARALVPALRGSDLEASEKVGIRAQLFDRKKRELVMDFLVERGERSVHILNAVSPGFTTAFAFSRYVVEEYGLK